MSNERKSVQSMGLRITLSLSFLAALVSASYLLSEERISATKFVSDVMNNMGRQQMLAQRIALLSRSMIDSPYPSARNVFQEELLSLATALEKDHSDLIQGGLSKKLPKAALAKVQSVYLNEPYFLERDITRLISSARNFAESTPEDMTSENPYYLFVNSLAQSDQLVKALNLVVSYYQQECDRVIHRAIFLGRVQLGLYFMAFLGMVLFIFRPMTKRLRGEMRELEDINDALGEHTQKLSQSNKKLKDKESALMEIMEDLAVQKKKLQDEVGERVKAQKTAQKYLDIAGVMFVLVDRDNVVKLINKKGCEILELPENEIVGKKWIENFIPDTQKELAVFTTDQIMRHGAATSEHSENAVLTKSGTERLIAWHNTPVRNDADEIVGTLSSGEDITERRAAEMKQAQLLEQLERVNAELSAFSHVVSHDLKAPLRGIGSLASWIASDYADKFDKEGKENMSLLIGRVKRMHDMIDGLLQLAKIGRAEGVKTETDLKALLTEIVDLLAPPKHIRIHLPDKLPTIVADPTRMQQVFQNLLSNAVKYMDKPKGEITVGCGEDDEFWHFNVQDNGPGIDGKYFQKIFEIFQTLAPRDSYESTGIGLSLVKKIVETYGGKIWIDSKVGEGSTFFFTISKSSPTKGPHAEQTADTAR